LFVDLLNIAICFCNHNLHHDMLLHFPDYNISDSINLYLINAFFSVEAKRMEKYPPGLYSVYVIFKL